MTLGESEIEEDVTEEELSALFAPELLAAASKARSRNLKRTPTMFEFIVRYPHGTNAVAGYQKAARHFGWRTRQDPSTAGSDQWRLLIARDDRDLRAVARRLAAYPEDDSAELDEIDYLVGEQDILLQSGVAWIGQDWKYWDIESDEGAMEHLGWTRTVSPHGQHAYRVTLSVARRKRAATRA